MRIKILAILVLSIFLMQPLVLVALDKHSDSSQQQTPKIQIERRGDKVYIVKRLPDKIVTMEMELKTAKIQQIGSSTHGLWWDTNWEYRVNITVTEPNIIDRTEWPVDVFLSFSPPAHKYSVRVVEVLPSSPYFQAIPYQIWNITYHNSTYISSAAITFFVSIGKGQSKKYQIYWSVKSKDAPSYEKKILVTETALPEGIKYTIASTYGWSIEIPPTNQGKPTNMTLQSGDRVGHTHLYFGPTRDPSLSYEGYLGTGNTDNNEQLAYRGLVEYEDPLAKIFSGVIFVAYKVEGANLMEGTTVVAKVNYTFRIFPWGILVEEKIKWLVSESSAEYYIGGWVFDQDDGSGVQPMFDRIGTEDGISQLASYYQYPSVSGSLSSYADVTIYDPSIMTYPGVRVYRYYFSVGTHIVEVRPGESRFIQRDQHGLIVYYPNGSVAGTATASRWTWDPYAQVSISVSPGEEGYYFIAVCGYDNRVGNPALPFDLYIDNSYWTSDVVEELGVVASTLSRAISPVDIYVPSEMQNVVYEVKLDWPTTANLDLYIYSQAGAVLNSSRTSKPEIVTFNAAQSGHYTALVHAVDATSTFVVEITARAGPEFLDDMGYGSWNDIAFFHSTEPRGIGMGLISEDIPDGIMPTVTTIWHNEGDESDVDYIYWARNISGLTVSPGDKLNISYAIVPWSPNGATDSERYSGFNTIITKVRNSLSYSEGFVERYLIRTTISVVDSSGAPIPNANVSFYNSTGSVVYTALTNSNGEVVFDVERVWYNISVRFTSGGLTYSNFTIVSYNETAYGYTVHSDPRTICFSYVVKLELTVYSSESPPNPIQGGTVKLNSSTAKNSRGEDIVITGTTNVYGMFIVYIPNGTWTIRFNKTATTPEDWDNITIYTDSALTNNITPPGRIHTLTIQSSVSWYIRDWEYPPTGVNTISTYFQVTTVPYPLNVYWKENVTLNISLYESLGDTLINGTIYWYIYDPSGNVVLQEEGSTDGLYYILEINTSVLVAGTTYTIHINGTVTEEPPSGYIYLSPQPVDKDMTVNIRLTEIDVQFVPSTAIYWNESLKISVTYLDSISNSYISGASVSVRILNVGEWDLTETSPGVYELYIANFYWDAGTYTVIVTASKQNYEQREKSYTILIYERPTDLNAPTYIEIPWQNEYNISVEYIDSRFSAPIKDANVTCEVHDVAENIIESKQCAYADGRYHVTLNISILEEGVYYIYFYAEKNNYESKIAKAVLEVRVRATSLAQSTTKLTIIYEQNIVVKFNYLDEDFGEWIAGATATYVMEGVDVNYWVEGNLYDLGNGSYLLNISSIDVGKLGTFTVSISISKPHYESQTATVTVIIEEIPTKAVSSTTSISLEWGLNISLDIWWNRTDKSPEEGITSATNASYKLYYNDTLVLRGNLTDLGNGTYRLILNTTEFVNESFPNIGTYMLYVFLGKLYYQNHTLTISITVDVVGMIISASTIELSLIWGYSANVTICYNRSRDSVFILGASKTVVSTPGAPGAFSWYEEFGRYILEINSTYMQDGQTYVLNVTLEKQFHETKVVIISVSVCPIPTIASSSLSSATTEYGLNLTVEFWYNRTDTDEGIGGATATYEIRNSAGNTIISNVLSENCSVRGKYYLNINSSIVVDANATPSVGTYTIYVLFSESHYEQRSIVITWTITTIATNAYAQPANITMIWGYIETINIYYSRKRDDRFVKGATINIDSTPSAPNAFSYTEAADFYLLEINGSALIEGTYTVMVELSKQYYEPKSLVVRIDVNPIPTIASSSLSSATTEYGLNLTVEFWYNRTDTDEGIGGATATYEIVNGSGYTILSDSLHDLRGGHYLFELNTTIVVAANNPQEVGPYTVNILFSKEHYESRTLSISWNIVPVRTMCYAASTNISLIWGDVASISIFYNRTRDGIFIKGASFAFWVYDEYGNPITVPTESFIISEEPNRYVLNINTSYLEIALYILEITFSKKHHDDAGVRIFMRVNPILAYAVPNVKSVSVEYPDNFTLKVWYYTEKYNITDANATYLFDYVGVTIDSGNLTFNATDNSYELIIVSRGLFNKSGAADLPLSLTLYIYLSREYHESKILTLAVTIEPIKTKLTLSEKSATLRYGQIWFFYMNYTNIDGTVPLYDANTQCNISYNGTLIISGVIPYNHTDGWYEFFLVFNSTYIVNKTLGIMDIRLPAVFEIRIFFGKKLYEKQTAIISVTVNPMETMLDVSATSVTIVYGESWLFNFSYIDIATGRIIVNAVAYYEIVFDGTVLKSEPLAYNDTHRYHLIFNSTELINETWPYLGTYIIHVYFWKRFYEVREKFISITVEPRDTYIDVSATSITIEYGESYVFEIRYIDTKTMALIENASKRTFKVVFDESVVWSGNLTYDPESKTYYLLFNSKEIVGTSMTLGTYVIYVELWELFYRENTKVLSVTITEIKTLAYSQPKNITVIWGRAPIVEIYYVVAKNNSIIPDANISVSSTPETPEGAFYVAFEEGRYVMRVNSSLLTVNIYYLVNITLDKEFYEKKVVVIRVDVVPIPTYLVLPKKTYELEYGEFMNISIWYLVYGTDEVLSDANATYIIYYEEYILDEGNFTFNSSSGAYSIDIDTFRIVDLILSATGNSDIELPVSVSIEVFFSKSVYLARYEVITLTIKKFTVSISTTKAPPQSVFRIQFIEEHKVSEIEMLITHKGSPVDDASVLLNISSVQAGMSKTYAAEKIGPGLFRASIDWADFPPGYKWVIAISIESVRMHDRWIPVDKIIYTVRTHTVFMDYTSGSTKIYVPGIGNVYIANMFMYPIIIVLLAVFAYGSYKFISWWLLPWQVKEINKLLKLIEKGVFKYLAPNRREYITQMLMKELEVEAR